MDNNCHQLSNAPDIIHDVTMLAFLIKLDFTQNDKVHVCLSFL